MCKLGHFISPSKIQNLFQYPQARTYIENEGHNAWVVVEKIGREKAAQVD